MIKKYWYESNGCEFVLWGTSREYADAKKCDGEWVSAIDLIEWIGKKRHPDRDGKTDYYDAFDAGYNFALDELRKELDE